MDKEKQIEEMARAISNDCEEHCDWCDLNGGCTNLHWAKEFYDAGYRKASDIVNEIFEEIFFHTYYEHSRPIIDHNALVRIKDRFQMKYTTK